VKTSFPSFQPLNALQGTKLGAPAEFVELIPFASMDADPGVLLGFETARRTAECLRYQKKQMSDTGISNKAQETGGTCFPAIWFLMSTHKIATIIATAYPLIRRTPNQ
jgi:hypothetical protein